MIALSTGGSLDSIERRYAQIYPLARMARLALRLCSTLLLAGCIVLLPGLLILFSGAGMSNDLIDAMVAVTLFVESVCFHFSYSAVMNLVHRMWRPAGALWAIGGAALIVAMIPGIAPTLESIMAPPAAKALHPAIYFLLGCGLIGLLAYWAWLLPITMLRGGFALLFAPPEQRLVMRETPSGRRFPGAALGSLLGLPPLTDFVHDSRARYGLVVALAALSGLLLAGAALATAAAPQLLVHAYAESSQYFASFVWPLVALPLGLAGLVFVLAIIGREIERAGFRQVRFSLEELQKVDRRPPVLFLRAFNDDQVDLPRSKLSHLGRALDFGKRRTNLDAMLLEELTAYGPLVALGNPSDSYPPYGAARQYFDGKTWQQAVKDLAQAASAVILCLDATDGVWWEVEHLVLTRQLAKTLFLVHPSHRAAAKNEALMENVISMMDSRARSENKLIDPHAQTVLAFFIEDNAVVNIFRSSSFSEFAYLLAIRTFVRSKLGMPERRAIAGKRTGKKS